MLSGDQPLRQVPIHRQRRLGHYLQLLHPPSRVTVSALQFCLVCLTAVPSRRCRIDLKYALGADLDDPGFHHSVLGDFRDRLLQEGGTALPLDTMPLRGLQAW